MNMKSNVSVVMLGLAVLLLLTSGSELGLNETHHDKAVSVELLEQTILTSQVYTDAKLSTFRTTIFFSPGSDDLYISIVASPADGHFRYEKLLVEFFDSEATTLQFPAGVFYSRIALRVSGLPPELCQKSVREKWQDDLISSKDYEKFVREIQTDINLEFHVCKIVFQGISRYKQK